MSTSRYTDKTYVGAGGMALVYKAFDEVLRRHVAVKEMIEEKRGDDSIINLFLDEARKMALIKHQNVVQVYDVIDDGDIPTIVMEFIDGGSLGTRTGTGSLSSEEVLQILVQVVAGLQAIHEAGFIHRDIKPENILEAGGVYKITDFGVAMKADDDTLPFVTNKYAAPEVLIDPGKINPSSDIYSVGIMAVELLLGPPKFEAVVKEAIEGDQGLQLPAIRDSVQAFWQQWVGSTAKLPNLHEVDRSISPAMAEFVAGLIDKDQDARPQDCAAVLTQIEKVRQLEGQRAAGVTRHDSTLKKKVEKAKAARAEVPATAPAKAGAKKKKPLWFKLVVGVAAMLMIGVAWLMLFAPEPRVLINVVSEPPGASVTVNEFFMDGFPTPMKYNAHWGDSIVLELEGHSPIQLTLAEDMDGLSESADGIRLEAQFSGSSLPVPEPKPEPVPPPRLSVQSSAEAAAILSERLPLEWPVEITLDGIEPAAGEYVVAVGTPLIFNVQSEQSGSLIMLHLGADNSLTRIYPSPAGAVLPIVAAKPTAVGTRLNLVAREPLGNEWVVLLVVRDDLVPPEITGSQSVSDWALNYPFGGDESPGRDMVMWLLEEIENGGMSGQLIEMEVVASGGGS